MRHKALSLLFVGLLLVTGQSLAAAQDKESGESPWIVYTSSALSLSFQYPADWTVEASDFEPALGRYGYTITVTPAAADPSLAGKIEMVYQDYEIREDQDLQTWVDGMVRTTPFFRSPPELHVLRRAIGTDANMARSDLLHVRTTRPGSQSETIWATHGRIVYALTTYVQSDRMSQVLAQMAESVRFAHNAPTSLDELYGVNRDWPSLEDALAAVEQMWQQTDSDSPCDLVCQDAEVASKIEPGTPHPGGSDFDEQEARYLEWLEANGDPSGGETGGELEGQVLSNRKALPSDWWAPVQVTGTATKNADCSSSWHGGDSAMAIDIQGVGTTTSVYAAQSGTVSATGWDPGGYGNYVVISSGAAVAYETRTYQHLYAHLSRRDVGTNDPANRGATRLGLTGSTGNSTGPHLHFHVRLNGNPVDLSPMLGFTPVFGYPNGTTCGVIESRANSPIIIEPVAFTQRYQPRSNHYWFCYNDLNRTTECYMKGVPNDRSGWDPLNPQQSPELRYATVHVPVSGTYTIWVCGWGGNYEDDSLHMGYADALQSTSDRISGFHPNRWVWSNITMDIVGGVYQPARISASEGDRVFNVWMREDGMRIDRILLTRSSTFPIATIRCGGY